MKDESLTDYEIKLINYIKRNRNKRQFFIVNIAKVAPSGMSRNLKFMIIYKNQPLNVTYLIAKILDRKMTKDDTIRVGGCGMDMVFHSLDCIYSKLGYEQAYRLTAVNNYQLF